MHLFARARAIFVRAKVFPINLFQSIWFFFSQHARGTTWLISRRVESSRGRVCRRVTREDRRARRLDDMDERGHVVNFYEEKNLTSRQTRGPDLPSGHFPFFSICVRDRCTLSLHPGRTEIGFLSVRT